METMRNFIRLTIALAILAGTATGQSRLPPWRPSSNHAYFANGLFDGPQQLPQSPAVTVLSSLELPAGSYILSSKMYWFEAASCTSSSGSCLISSGIICRLVFPSDNTIIDASVSTGFGWAGSLSNLAVLQVSTTTQVALQCSAIVGDIHVFGGKDVLLVATQVGGIN
jgi:hypothetical protein